MSEITQWLQNNPRHLAAVHERIVQDSGVQIEGVNDRGVIHFADGTTERDQTAAYAALEAVVTEFSANPPTIMTDDERIAQLEAQVQALLDQLGGGA